VQKVERELEWNGKVAVDASVAALQLKGDLICIHCHDKLRNMPALKRHLAECTSS